MDFKNLNNKKSKKQQLNDIIEASIKKYDYLKKENFSKIDNEICRVIRYEIPEYLSTNCDVLDGLFQGGIPYRCVTEIYGHSGSGKTQFCLQILASSLKYNLNSRKHSNCIIQSIFVDTENSFCAHRFMDILKGSLSESCSFNEMDLLIRNIHVLTILNCEQLIKFVDFLPDILKEIPTIKLIIFDSASAPFWNNDDAFKERAFLIVDFARKIQVIAMEHNLMIIVTNRAKISTQNTPVPSLGAYWSAYSQLKVLLEKNNLGNVATVKKSDNRTFGEASFRITVDGLK